jgi:hypothetical protein
MNNHQSLDLVNVNDALTFNLTGADAGSGVAAFQYISGAGTVVMEGTLDGTNWIALLLTNRNTGATAASATAAGIYSADFSGLEQVRVRKSVGSASCVIVMTLKVFA